LTFGCAEPVARPREASHGRLRDVPARSPEHQAVGAALRRLRERNDMSLSALARALDVDRGYLRGIERGERNASLELLLLIANYFDRPLSAIILDAEAHSPNEESRPP
jgi:transcriptional regulator with XRE-family HTH domain